MIHCSGSPNLSLMLPKSSSCMLESSNLGSTVMFPHILVIDDQINLAHFIEMELNAEGYRVSVECDNLAELPATLHSIDPDLVILNWELRSASGKDVCRQLKLSQHRAPVVVVTVEDQLDYRSRSELGAQDCLTKPFSMNALLKRIQHYLKH